MLKGIIIALIALGIMEGLAWYAIKVSKTEVREEPKAEEVTQKPVVESTPVQEKVPEAEPESTQETDSLASEAEGGMGSDYPKITTEVINGRTERTIHMGVRKWVWEPSTLRAKQGELVRLVIHNADVDHPLYIPELGIEAEVPPEGAVVEFEAKKKGSFFFLCGRYCGEGHAEMQGTLIID